MTVEELIAELQSVDPKTVVLRRGHIGGFFVPLEASQLGLGDFKKHVNPKENAIVSITNPLFQGNAKKHWGAPFKAVVIL
jgi:hypothetical protein